MLGSIAGITSSEFAAGAAAKVSVNPVGVLAVIPVGATSCGISRYLGSALIVMIMSQVTTTVLALAARWPAHREPLVVEADPAGGDLVARLTSLDGERGGLRDTPSTVQLAASARSGLSDQTVLEHLQRLPGPDALPATRDRDRASGRVRAPGGYGLCLSAHQRPTSRTYAQM